MRSTAVLLLALLAASCARKEPERVFVIVVDTLRADALGCYGADARATPELDRLASDGVRFEQAISSSGWTLPSIASLLTGTWPELHKASGKEIRLTPVSPDVPLAQELLRAQGFKTLAFANAAFLSPLLRLNRGFDLFDHEHAYNRKIRRADATVEAALAAVGHFTDEPLFVLVHLFDPHLDYDPPAGFAERFTAGRSEPAPPLSMEACRALEREGGRPDAADVAYVRGVYQGEVAFVDAAIGRLRAGLERLGMWEGSTVIVTADHGEEFWEHGGFEHGHTLYPELIHVPLLVKLPHGEARGTRVAAQVRTLDCMPSVFELVGIAPPASFVGRSLLPLVRGVERDDRIAFSQGTLYGSDKLSWRTARYHYVVDQDAAAARREELYDWRADPLEQHDLAPAAPDALAQVRGELREFYLDLVERGKALRTPPLEDLGPERIREYERSLEALGYTGR